MTAIAALSGVEKTFANGVKGLGPLDLELEEGEFVSLLGPSGCGKSTALRLIAGLIAPSAGGIVWPHGKSRIGFVFQEPTLMPWTSVAENIYLPLRLAGVARRDAATRIDEAIAAVGLDGFAHAYPRELSGGMKN